MIVSHHTALHSILATHSASFSSRFLYFPGLGAYDCTFAMRFKVSLSWGFEPFISSRYCRIYSQVVGLEGFSVPLILRSTRLRRITFYKQPLRLMDMSRYTTPQARGTSSFVLCPVLVAPSSLHPHQLDWLAQPCGDRRFDPVVAAYPLALSLYPLHCTLRSLRLLNPIGVMSVR